MDNSKFRDLIKERAEKTPAPNGGGSSTDSAEERARKKAKKQAEYDRRMAIQKRREEALAEANKYHDRAAERRVEELKRLKESGAPPEAFVDKEDAVEPMEQFVSSAPTFAQTGNREDLSGQQHRLSIEQSKYLGGDIEHTHLVKGLDFALLQKTRSELTSSQSEVEVKRAARQVKLAAASAPPSGGTAQKGAAGGGSKADAAAPAKLGASGGAASAASFATEMGRDVHRAIFGERSRPNRALSEGRLVLVFDVEAESHSEVPATLIRASDDLSGPRRPNTKQYDAGLPTSLLSRLSKVMAQGHVYGYVHGHVCVLACPRASSHASLR